MPLYKSETNSPKRGPSDKSQIQTKFQHSISRFIISRFTPLLSGYAENIFIDSLRSLRLLCALCVKDIVFLTRRAQRGQSQRDAFGRSSRRERYFFVHFVVKLEKNEKVKDKLFENY